MAAHTCFLLEMQENVFSKGGEDEKNYDHHYYLNLDFSRKFLKLNSSHPPELINVLAKINTTIRRTWETDKLEKSWWSPSNCLLLLIFIGDPFPPLGSRRHTETFLRCLSHRHCLLISWEPLLAVNSLPEGNLVDLKSGRRKKNQFEAPVPRWVPKPLWGCWRMPKLTGFDSRGREVTNSITDGGRRRGLGGLTCS